MDVVSQKEKIEKVADMIIDARKVVVFTGAGISTESGIPDFRSPGGLWSRFDPEDFTIERFLNSPETRKKQWHILVEGGLTADVQPNRAHFAITELERLGKLSCVVTQNVDNLHQKAGVDPEKVFELHGNMRWLRCLGCGERYAMEGFLEKYRYNEEVPICEKCSGILKPDVVFFGESLPERTFRKAVLHAGSCDLLLVIGSSLVVHPAAYIPAYAQEGGAKLVIINIGPTSFDREADVVINASAGEVMAEIIKNIKMRV
ncbi:MAG: NAD-dependent deacylase [Smithellaceae bacterium]|nr:NAD-dependent deacylase [Smithellaceae bacterium]